MNLTAQSNW